MDGQVVERVSPLDELDGRTGGWSRWFPLLVVVAALGYVFVSPYARGSDSSGYLNSPDYSTHGNLLALVRVLPGFSVTEFWTDAYQPQGFKIRDNSDGAMSPTYRTGFPMHIALATFLIGSDNAVAFINILLALASGPGADVCVVSWDGGAPRRASFSLRPCTNGAWQTGDNWITRTRCDG